MAPRLTLDRLTAAPANRVTWGDDDDADCDWSVTASDTNPYSSSSTQMRSPSNQPPPMQCSGQHECVEARVGATPSLLEAISLLFAPLPRSSKAELARYAAIKKGR